MPSCYIVYISSKINDILSYIVNYTIEGYMYCVDRGLYMAQHTKQYIESSATDKNHKAWVWWLKMVHSGV